MRGERTKDRDALINKYGMTARLATRVVALGSKKIDITRSVLEAAAEEESLQRLLLKRQLLTKPDRLTTEWLRTQADQCHVPDPEALQVVGGNNAWKTIAFEDDVLAEQVEENVPKREAGQPREMTQTSRSDIPSKQSKDLFTPDEVAQLKLDVLTSQDSSTQVEALRKLIYAPIKDGDKASVFVRALIDPDSTSKVRQQAVRSLHGIGFREEFARTVHHLFEADEEDVLYSIRRLDKMMDEAEDSERSVALAVVLQVFSECSRPVILNELLDFISDSITVLTQHKQKTDQFVQTSLRKLTRFYEHLSDSLFHTLRQCYEASPDTVDPLLWKELDRSSDPAVRAFIVHILSQVMDGEGKRKKLADAALSELLNADLPEDHRTQLRYGLLRLGEVTVHVANERLLSGSGQRNAELVRILDIVCTDAETPDDMVNETVRTLLNTLQVGDRITRRRIVRSSVISDPRAEPQLRHQVAEELLAHIGEFEMESTLDIICHTLGKLGPPAIAPLFDFIQRHYPQQHTRGPLLSLGRIVEKWQGQIPEEQVQKILHYCTDLLDDPRASRGSFTITLAYFVGYTKQGADRFEDVMHKIMEMGGMAGFTFDVFEALSILAGSPNVAPDSQRELFERFRDVLHMETPGPRGVKKKSEEGTVYEFGPEMMFDTRLLPNVVQGLEQIGVNPTTPQDLRREVVKEMLILWEGVSNVRIVWGPAAMSALVQAIRHVACSDLVSTEVRTRLGHSILRFLNKISVVRSIGQICSRPASDEPMRNFCVEAGRRMLSEWETCEEQDQERRIALLKSLSQVAANVDLESSDPEIENMRTSVMQALFRALREGLGEVQEPLERLRDCPALADDKREKIRDRLTRFYGLVQNSNESA